MTKTLERIQNENALAVGFYHANPMIYEDICREKQKPLSLNRVLNALGMPFAINTHGDLMAAKGCDEWDNIIYEIHEPDLWDLTKETLEEQSEETQRKINELLV